MTHINTTSLKNCVRNANIKDIRVTHHAHNRFLERFRLYFYSSKVSSKYMWNSIIAEKVKEGRICDKWEQSPFWLNRNFTRYGKFVVVNNGPCFFICKVKNNSKIIVTTVVAKWYNEKCVWKK